MSNFDKQLEEELEKLKKKKKTLTPLQNALTGGRYSNLPTDDIAPVLQNAVKKATEKSIATVKKTVGTVSDDERTWFQKGAFEDGYQFGDITKTILGSSQDLFDNALTGVLDIGEKAVDALATIAPYIAQGMYYSNGGGYNIEADRIMETGFKQAKKETAEFVEKDLYDAEKVAQKLTSNSTLRLLGADTEKGSVFGEKSDSLAQSAGQLGAQIGTNLLLPGSGMALMGVTAFGGESENALKNGATLEEAAFSGAVSAGAEILTEKLGGISFGGKTLTDAAFNQLSRHMTGKLSKVLLTTGKVSADALSEGGEEILSGYMSAIGQKLSYMEEKEIEELFSDEDKLESFIGGVVLGGAGGVGGAVKSAANGVDYVTELTKNEQKVVEKVYKDRVAEAEKNGKISGTEKSKIYDDVLEKMEKGYLSTDDIESALGDRSAYDALQKESEEFKTLYETESGKLSKKQQDRLAELEAKNKATPYETALKDAKSKYSKSVFNLVRGENKGRGSRLLETYNEKARMGQDFQADFEKYKGTKHEEAARKTIESAIQAGANNTNRVHDLVDMAAQISADTGRTFYFKSGEQIKTDFLERQQNVVAEMESIPEAKRTAEQTKKLTDLKDLIAKVESGETVVNGDITEDGITLNLDSTKPLNRTVGHEVTHSLEKAKSYKELKESLFAYAKSKGIDIESELNTRKLMYEGITDANPEAELVSDLVGDFLFTDSNYIKKLSTENRNVFQKIWDEVKYLYSIATAGSQEARELAKVKKAFEDAYRESAEKNTADGGGAYSLVGRTADGLGIYKTNYPLNTPKSVKQADLIDLVQNVWSSKPITLTIVENGEYVDITARFNPELSERSDLAKIAFGNRKGKAAEQRMTLDLASDLYQIAEESKFKYSKDAIPKPNNPAHDGVTKYHYFLTNLVYKDDSGNYIPSHMNIDVKRNGDGDWFYSFSIEKGSVPQALLAAGTDESATLPSANLPNIGDVVKRDYSLSDSDGKKLTKEQQEYFKDSKVRDENGNLKVMYHGSQNGGFHVFDSGYSDDGTSFFFVDSNEVASSYSGTSETYSAKTFRTAEDFNKFFVEIGASEYKVAETNGKFVLLEDGDEVATSDTADGIYEEFRDWSGLGHGDVNYKVYLNLKNPLEVDADGRDWNALPAIGSAETYEYIKIVEVADVSGKVTVEYAMTGDNAPTTETVDLWERFDTNIADLLGDLAPGESMQDVPVHPSTTREYAKYAKENGYDGVIFKNIYDIGGYGNNGATEATVAVAFDSNQIKSVANTNPTEDADIRYSLSENITEAQNAEGLDRKSEALFSLSHDTAYMDKAIALNNSSLRVDSNLMTDAKALRKRIADRMNAIKDRGLVGLPEDIEGNTYIANSSYDGTEENTTICPRSLASEAFVDAVSEYLGRPLTVEEQIYISQDLQGRSLTPECTYCYVATDRKAYRAFLGEYIKQRDSVLQKLKDNPNADVSKDGALYNEFLNGRKPTDQMYNRFKMWVNAYKNGTPMVEASHLANINKLMGDINSEFGDALKPQIVDAMKYAQSASWAKKRINYVAYNGHILNWKQDRINKLNSHYGLRMYSFSDFHPAFVLENMQMITDASVRGLKMLGYTKDTDFVEIFAPSGMNINVSTFGFESGGNVYENNLIGAEWEKAKALRAQYPNVGVTFVATNDTLVEWALAQDWIDVVIPYHLVRTGAEVAKAFGYTNYTSESADTKTKEWAKGDKKYIAPTEHNNDLETYLKALEKNHLKPRFERFIENPNYMKLVNECRQSASQSKPVQPVFNEDAAMTALAKLEANGYYQPIGGSVDRMYEIAAEVAEDMMKQLAPQNSLSNAGEQFAPSTNDVYGKDFRVQNPAQDIAPVAENATTVSETESVAPVAVSETETTTEELFPDDVAPIQEEYEFLLAEREDIKGAMDAYAAVGDYESAERLMPEYEKVQSRIAEIEADDAERIASIEEADAPPEKENSNPEDVADDVPLTKTLVNDLAKEIKSKLGISNKRTAEVRDLIERYSKEEFPSKAHLYTEIAERFGIYTETEVNEELKGVKSLLRTYGIKVDDSIKKDIADYGQFMRSNFGKVRFSNEGLPVDVAYKEFQEALPGYFPERINVPSDQLLRIVEVANMDTTITNEYEIDWQTLEEATDTIMNTVGEFKQNRKEALANKHGRESFQSLMESADQYVPPYKFKNIAPTRAEMNAQSNDDIAPVFDTDSGQQAFMPEAEAKDDIAKRLDRSKAKLREEYLRKRADLESATKNKNAYISQKAAELYQELRGLRKGVRASEQLGYLLDFGYDWSSVRAALVNIQHTPDHGVNENSAIESIARKMLNEDYDNSVYEISELEAEYERNVAQLEADAEKERTEGRKATRKELHENIVDNIKTTFREEGFDFDETLKNAKDLSTFATVDNTPQRVMEKALGYKQGQVLGDLTVNKVAQNETEGIKWLNSFTDRKNGLLAKISKQYKIKPGSKESAAAQMYAEGFYVGENNAIIAYGDKELAADFRDVKVQENIKKLARDPRIRQIYDETLAAINASRTRNAYPEIPRLDNYFLHFRAMEDTFSRLGLPFNPNDIRAKDLPTDLNGVTADLKPGQPYFASAKHRMGKRTSFDLLGGLEKYLTSAKNQIYHIDDIQTLRALRNYVAETYGQAHGLENIDTMSDEEAEQRINEVYNSHLSTFAKFLNEEANVLAGKTSLIDRGLEGVIGRRGITFLDSLNKQVGANMVGFNVSSSLTNFLAPVQAFAKSNKFDFVKAMAQTSYNKIGSIFGKGDTFAEDSPVMIRRKGADRFYRTPFEKVGDAGYVFMSAVDDISTELIARTKYNELTRKGMDSQQAHYETDKWVSRLMGDRSLGQQPQLYNSKMLGLVTKFQLEVRNQLDSQFYDTIQEAKVSTEDIENGLLRNAKKAAKITSTFVQLAVAQHLFGKAFESVAGYNPAFDIIGAIIKAFGWDDEEESEDTVLDNIEQGFLELLGDLPYTSTLTGGRIPIESALPITELIKGEDRYGNEKSRWDTLKEVAPYYILPGGYGQLKKTAQGLGMFSEDHPIAGSYTDSGNLRFPVEDTLGNRIQAGLFGQYASGNARDYFDNDRSPLKEKQIQEFIDVGMTIQDYWKYRDGLSKLNTLAEKADYISGLDLTTAQKNVLINNIADRKEDIDMSDYGNYGSFEEFDFAVKNPEKYSFLKENNVSYSQYKNFDEDTKDAYDWAFQNPEKFTLSKAIASDVATYRKYTKDLNEIKADKDSSGKTISGSRKEKVIDYINNLDATYGEKIILYKSLYEADNTYNNDIVEYLNSRNDISYQDTVTILRELGFTVLSDGTVQW